MASFSRSDVAKWADVPATQLEYLIKAGVVSPDVGDQRKRLSLNEARLTVIAGCALAMGISAQALQAPIKWLREHVAWPSVDLPDSPADIAIELSADALRNKDFPLDKRATILAARALGITVDTLEGIEQRRAEAALARAHELLKQPKKWDIKTRQQVERALDFERACRGDGDLFFHVSASADSWATFLATDVARVEGQAAWLVIDIRRLFSQRGPMF